MSHRPRVLLATSTELFGAIRLPRLFAHAGCEVVLIAPGESALARTRFAEYVLPAPSGVAATADLTIELLRHWDFDKAIAIDEALIAELADRARRETIPEPFPLPVRGRALAAIGSKFGFPSLAHHAGLPVPRQRRCTSPRALVEACDAIGYPLVLKSDRGSSGAGVAIVREPSGLGAACERLGGIPLIVQSYCAGRVGTIDALFARGKLLVGMPTFQLSPWPNETSPSTGRGPADVAGLREAVRSFGATTGADGLINLDFIETPDGPRFLEMNARPTQGVTIAPGIMRAFSSAVRAWLAGDTHEEHWLILDRPVYVFPSALGALVRGTVGVGDGLDALRALPFDDPAVLRPLLGRLTGRAMRRAFKDERPGRLVRGVPVETVRSG